MAKSERLTSVITLDVSEVLQLPGGASSRFILSPLPLFVLKASWTSAEYFARETYLNLGLFLACEIKVALSDTFGNKLPQLSRLKVTHLSIIFTSLSDNLFFDTIDIMEFMS